MQFRWGCKSTVAKGDAVAQISPYYLAEHNPIFLLLACAARCKDDWFICSPQRFKPFGDMKNGCAWQSLQKLHPSGIR
jgi:hypothetical protein